MTQFLQDLRYGVRLMGKSPGYTGVAVLALALGIGANTSAFTGISALLLHPLPFRNLDRIVMIWETSAKLRQQRSAVSPANFIDWRDQSTVFDQIAAHRPWNVNLTGVGQPERLQGALVSASFFPLLGVSPSLGRVFSLEEEQTGHHQVVVVSHGFWQRSLGANPNIVGARLTLDGRVFTVVGVMWPDFDFPLGTDLWSPLALSTEERSERGAHLISVVARLRPGVSLSQARAEMAAVAGRLERQYPSTNAGRGVLVAPLLEAVVSSLTNRFTLIILAAAGFVLLLACANVANLQLARVTGRHKEIAIRAALGASRWRLVRQLIAESVLLSLLGAVLAVLLAVWGVDLMRAAIPQEIYRVRPGLKYLEVDGGVLGFTLIIALLAGVMLGLVPALQASGRKAFSALNDALKEGGRTSSAGSAGGRARGLLVISEVALALVLLVGAGLMVKAFRHMSTVDAGFNPRNLLTMRLALPEAKYRQANQAAAFYDQVLQQLAALPQVRATATAGNLGIAEGFLIEGRPEPEPGEPRPAVQPVSADYFRAMGIPVLKGRPISEHDTAEAPLAAVLSESVIRHYWPRVRDPIGARVRVGGPQSPWFSVVGVVGDVKDWFSGQPQPAIYLSHLQRPQHSMKLLIRTSGDPLRVVSGARAQVRSLDADQPVYDVESMEQYLAGQTSGVRISATMIAVFAAMALVLAAAGIYAVISYSAAQRTHEIGVRMALGATRGDVLKLVVGHALKLALAGLALGLPAAYALTHAMSSALFGVIALDAATFAAFTLLLAATALLAGYFPARRATRVAPIVALRYE